MDALAGLLDGPRARGAFLLRVLLEPPWSVRVQDEAPLSLAAVVRGGAWVLTDDGDRMEAGPGDVIVTRGPQPFTFADDPATKPQVIILPGERCVTPDGVEFKQAMDLGVRTWGNDPNGRTQLLIGTYQLGGEITRRLLSVLPPVLILPDSALESPLIPLLEAEMSRDEPGQEAVLDRLLDLLLITVLRTWFARPEAQAPGWYQALADPLIGPTLRMLQNNPAHPWTVTSLAKAVGVSRAALARRFTSLVGEPPMAYLTNWRLDIAADLLREENATIASVARRVGYSSPFALSTAFKRVRGVSPHEHRHAALTST